MIWTTPAIWNGGECWILAGGPSVPYEFGVPENVIDRVMKKHDSPSVYSPYLEPIHNKHVIGVNNAYTIGEWIDAVFFGDCSWYLVHRKYLARWSGLKVTSCERFEKKRKEDMEGIKYLPRDKKKRFGITENKSAVSWNSNSGAAAISLAAHFGVRRIILLGFDMTMATNGFSHWHGTHSGKPGVKPRKNPPFNRHIIGFPTIAQDAKQLGIEIINASPNSAIEDFPKVPVKELIK